MLYLTEVRNQTRGLIGGYRTELKLLACQGNDQMWSPISGEEVVISDNFNEQITKGTLFIVNLGAKNEIKGTPELAGNRLLNVLKQFSRVLEKSKNQEGEIEQWRVSLKIQAEELANRQGELDTQQDQLLAKEVELANLQEERDKLHEAWKQLQEDQRKLQENVSFEGEQLDKMNSLLTRFSDSIVDSNSFQEHHRQVIDALNNQQEILDHYWQQLERDKNQVQQQQEQVDHQSATLKKGRQRLNSTWESLQQSKIDLQIKQNIITSKEELIGRINLYLEGIKNLKGEVNSLTEDSTNSDSESKVDLNALENMPLGDLEGSVDKLQQETVKTVNFVNMQEEELTLQGDLVREIEEKLAQANEIDKLSLETELADAQEAMKLLDKTLVGQRRILRRQQQILNQHLKILNRRKGIFDLEACDTIDIQPVLKSLERQENNLEEQKQKLDSEIHLLRESLPQTQQIVEELNKTCHDQEGKLRQHEENWRQSELVLAQLQFKVHLLEESIHAFQEHLDNIRNNFQNMERAVTELEHSTNEQNQVIQEIQRMIYN